MTESDELIDRLVRIHGEQGLSPTRQDWLKIIAAPAHQPLDLLNLLRFHSEVSTPNGTISGAEAYARYSSSVGSAFRRVGGELLYRNSVAHSFGTVAGTPWDAIILTRYPSPRALATFWLDDEFVAGHAHRMSGVQASRVLVLSRQR